MVDQYRSGLANYPSTQSFQLGLVAFCVSDWYGPWRNRQQLLTRLAAQGWPVVFSNGLYNRWDLGSTDWRQAPLQHR